MIYTIILSEANLPDTPLVQFDSDTDFDRLSFNSLFEYKDKLYRVYKTDPLNNPPNSDVTYYVTIENPDAPLKEGLVKSSYYNVSESEKLLD